METLRERLAQVAVLPARRRNWSFVGMVVVWFVTTRFVIAPLDRQSPLTWVVAVVLGYGGLFSLTQIWSAVSTGMLFGRPLPFSPPELVRFAGEKFRDIETWTSADAPDDVLQRLAGLTVPTTPILVQRLPDALFLRFQRWHQPEPWPSSAPLPRRIKVRVSVLILVTADGDGVTTVDAHWNGEPRLTDAMRAHAQLGRDVVDAARALTEHVDREPDPTPSGDR